MEEALRHRGQAPMSARGGRRGRGSLRGRGSRPGRGRSQGSAAVPAEPTAEAAAASAEAPRRERVHPSATGSVEVLALRRRYARVGRCFLCGPVAFASSHKSTHGPHHDWDHLNDEELIEYAVKKRKLTTPQATGHDFLIDFGTHSGKHLSHGFAKSLGGSIGCWRKHLAFTRKGQRCVAL